MTIVNDDGFARHGGIGIRGSPARRSRKVLVLEDGFPVNMSLTSIHQRITSRLPIACKA